MDDAADDPAVWVHPSDAGKSLILGTDKKHGLFMYTLAGKQVQALSVGRLNNVDVRQGIRGMDLAAATNRTTKTIDLFAIAADGKVTAAMQIPSGFDDPYGICMYVSRTTGELHVFGCDKGGLVRQWRIDGDRTDALRATAVRSFEVGAQAEGMVCDEDAGYLFIGEERAGVWRYPAEASAEFGRTLIAAASPLGPLVPDVEGLAISRPASGPAHLVVSSQGDNSFHLFDLAPPHAHRGAFRIGGFRDSRAADGGSVQETDGIEVYAKPLGPAFPEGIMVAQDGENEPSPQNFKLISWAAVRRVTAEVAGRPGSAAAESGKEGK